MSIVAIIIVVFLIILIYPMFILSGRISREEELIELRSKMDREKHPEEE